jgi:hypothetical protein
MSRPSSQANRTSQWILGRTCRGPLIEAPSQARRMIIGEGQGDYPGPGPVIGKVVGRSGAVSTTKIIRVER